MYFVKRIVVANNNNHQQTKTGKLLKNLDAALRAALKHDAAVVVEQASGKHVGYGRGGVVAFYAAA